MMVAPSQTKKQSSGKTDPSDKSTTLTGRRDLDLTPRDYFEKVAIEDLKQNKRLSMSSENGRDYKSGQTGRKPTRLRFVICVLGLLALAMCQMSRMVMNLTITQMVERDKHQHSEPATADTKISSDGSCPWPEDDEEEAIEATEVCPAETTTQTSTESDDLLDEAQTQTTVEPLTTSRNEEVGFITTTTETEIIPTTTTTTTSPMPTNRTEIERNQLDQQVPKYPQFKWSSEQQQVLLGGFFYSYFIFMIAGGRLAEVYGAKYVLMSAVAGSAVINLATPWLAVTSFELLVGSRILMGALQAGVVPGLYALIAKWLTMTEASIFAPLIKMNLRLGMLLGSSIPGLISGWPNVFYLTGSLSVVWSVLWMFLATSDPADNSWVSPAELQRIERKKQLKSNATKSIELKERQDGVRPNGELTEDEPVEETKSSTPWIRILTAPSVVALIVIKLTFNYALDFITIELPSYLNYVHHATKQQVSSITSAMYFTQVVLIVFVGWLAKVAVQRRPFGLNKTGVRKLFQGIASFGLGLTYFLLTFNDCNLLYVAVLFNVGSLLSMFVSGGETVLPYDLSEKYPATIVAIANSIANVSAVTTTTTVALVLGDQKGSFARWNVLLYLVAAVNFIGGLVFTLLVKAEPIDFDRVDSNKKKSDLEASNTPKG